MKARQPEQAKRRLRARRAAHKGTANEGLRPPGSLNPHKSYSLKGFKG